MKGNLAPLQSGFGFDSHAFASAGTLVLGGMRFKGVPALAGHSDGDAVLHALIDALLGACGLGDIGGLFPDTSRKFKGISSSILLKSTLKKIKQHGYQPHHVDITIVADRPRLSPVRVKMTKLIADALGLRTRQVNIKGKTPEGLVWFVPQGGVAVWALASVSS